MSRFSDFIETQRKLQTLEQLLKHVEAMPADPRVRLRLGDVLQSLRRVDEAVVQYREAALLLAKRGFEKQARAVRALILRLVPGDIGAIRDLTFSNDMTLAAQQAPLPREEKELILEEDDGADVEVTAGGSAGGAATLRTPPPPKAGPPPPRASLPGGKPLPALPASLPLTPALPERVPAFSFTADGLVVDVSDDSPAEEASASAASRTGSVVPAKPSDRRGLPRAHADGVVRLFGGGRAVTGFVEDVSQTGLFVAGQRVFQPGEIVDVALQLPQAAWIGLARAKVMRSVEASRRHPEGLGLALLWADSPTERWIEDFVATVFGIGAVKRFARFGEMGDEKKDEDIRRIHPRGEIDLPAALRGPEYEAVGWVRDLSMGGAFVEAPRVFGAGRRVELLLWLPHTYAPIVIDSVIAHDSRPPKPGRAAGQGVRFVKMNDGLAEELRKLLPELDREAI